MQAIYDVVGDKIQEIFDAQVVDIAILDEATGLLALPVHRSSAASGCTREPIAAGRLLEARARDARAAADQRGRRRPSPSAMAASWRRSGRAPKSRPLRAARRRRRGDRRRSRSQNIDREHAFSESDQQLLTTLAGSLSVALENARLVHETRQRNAELALINSVQEALAGELELQAIYDVVGDKIQEIFDAQVVDIGIFDFAAGSGQLPVHDRARRPLP